MELFRNLRTCAALVVCATANLAHSAITGTLTVLDVQVIDKTGIITVTPIGANEVEWQVSPPPITKYLWMPDILAQYNTIAIFEFSVRFVRTGGSEDLGPASTVRMAGCGRSHVRVDNGLPLAPGLAGYGRAVVFGYNTLLSVESEGSLTSVSGSIVYEKKVPVEPFYGQGKYLLVDGGFEATSMWTEVSEGVFEAKVRCQRNILAELLAQSRINYGMSSAAVNCRASMIVRERISEIIGLGTVSGGFTVPTVSP